MKLAFSTIGCPEWSFKEIYAAAKDMNFDGVEIRGIADEVNVPKIKVFSEDKIDKTVETLKSHNLEISMLTSGICLGIKNETAYDEACEYLDLAHKLGVLYVRLMISDKPYPEDVDMEKARSIYEKICRYGEDKGVMPLIETNGTLADSAEMKKFIESINSENKGVLWDIHHPYRFFNEPAKLTCQNIGKYVKYVHVKDSVMQGGKVVYRMMGYGDVPVYDCLKSLKEIGYDGYVTFEWVKRWNKDLESGGIVFAHYMNYMTFLLGRLNVINPD